MKEKISREIQCAVSVCMATYNGEKYIREQIDSILSQLSANDELVISDDGSNDDTIDIIREYKDERIRLYHNTRHGVTWNFENALRHSRGDVIFLADQDDVWKPGKVERMKEWLKSSILVIHNADVVDKNGNLINEDYFSLAGVRNGFWRNLVKFRHIGCCMAFRRQLLLECMPFPRGVVCHDYWICMYALAKYGAMMEHESFLLYRRHGNNTSSASEASDTSFFFKLFEKRLPILFCVGLRIIKNMVK